MEPIESSETSAYINTLTPGTYPKEKKLRCFLCLWLSTSFPFQLLKHLEFGKYFESLNAATSVIGNPYFTVRNVAFTKFVWMQMIVCRECVMSMNSVERRKWLQCVQWTVAFIWISLWVALPYGADTGGAEALFTSSWFISSLAFVIYTLIRIVHFYPNRTKRLSNF